MKSHKTGPSRHRLLVVNSVILLLVNCLVLVQSDDAQGEIELANWIKVAKDNWPQADTDSNEFLVYHSEYATSQLFGLKKTFFDDIDLVSNPDLNFRYWANQDSSLRSRKDDKSNPKREIRLKGEKQWYPSSDTRPGDIKSDLKSISPEDWKNFGFVQQNVFTLALKDVNVKYVQKLHLDKLDSSEVTAYKGTPNHDNFKESDENPTIDTSGVIHFNLTEATFELTSLNAKSIKFDLVQNDNAVATVTITPDKSKLSAELKPLFTVTLDDSGKLLKEVTFLTKKRGFLVSKIAYIEATTEVTITPEDFLKSHFGKSYTLEQVDKSEGKGYVQLKETQSTDAKNKDKDICYSIQKIDGPKAVIDVYLTLKDAPVGIKLDTLGASVDTKKICLFDYIALQKLGDYMVTFELSGTVAALKPFKLSVKTDYKNSQAKNLVVPEGEVKSGEKFRWLFYNPQAFEYSIEIDNDSNAQFLICDIVANCYPYESKDNKKFTLPQKVQKELEQTPYVRVQAFFTDGKKATFANNEIARFNKRFLADNEKAINGKPTGLEFEVKFDDKNEATFTVPLDLVDLRAQQLITEVTTTPNSAKTTLVKWGYKKAPETEEYSFPPEALKDAKIEANFFHLSTDQLFDYEPSQVPSGNSASFTLRKNPAATKVTVKFVIKKLKRNSIKDKYSFKDDTDRSKLIKVYPQDNDFFKAVTVKNEIPLKANTNRALITNWIRAGTDQKLLNSELITSLTVSSTVKDVTPANITVYRVIISQANPEFVQIKETSQAQVGGKNAITYVDDIKKDENLKAFSTKGSFRIGYIVHSAESFDATVVVNQLDVQGKPTSDAATNNCLKEATVALSDCQYEAPSCPFAGEPNGNTCNLKKINRLVEKQCDMSIGCSNIFDRRLPVSAYYVNVQSDPADPVEYEYVPFQIEPTKGDKYFYLQYKRPAKFPKGDFCLSFTYKSKQSPLVVSESVNSSGIIFPVAPASNPNQDGKVCASWLSDDVDSVEGFYFEFERSQLYDIDNHNIDFEDDATAGETESTIKEGIYINNLERSQFTFPTKLNRVTESFERKDTLSNALKLTIPVEKLKALPATAQVGNYEAYVYTIRTKWIKLAKNGEHLKIGFTYDAATDAHKISNIKLKVNSPYEQVWKGDISVFKSDEIHVVTDAIFGTSYQVEIFVELNQTKILEIKNDLKEDFIVTLKDFSINDPCVDAKNKLETCSGADHGTCIRTYQEGNFTGLCECNKVKFFHGTQCELQDYCAQDAKQSASNKVCKTKVCKNDDENKQVACECETNQVWSVFLKSCVDTKELICAGANEILKYDPRTKKPICPCMDGFVPFNKTCVPYDICSPVHRGIKSISPKNPCLNEHTTCVPNDKKTSITCPCDSGYFLDFLDPNSKCLPEDKCKSCEHRCYLSGKEYQCQERCKNGYVYNTEKKECEITDAELQKLALLLPNCSGKKVELKDGKPSCVCGNQKFDPITRGCSLTECSAENLKTCTDKGAISCTLNQAKPVCVCKDGDIPYSDNQTSSSAWKCMSRCEVLELPEQHNAKCLESFSYCDPTVPFTKFVPDTNGQKKGLQSAGLIEGVFVFNNTELDSTADKDYCKCQSGFRKVAGKCLPYERTIHSINGMEFDWNPYTDEITYRRDVQTAFEVLIKTVLNKAKPGDVDIFYETKCEKSGDKTISCSTNFESDQDDTKIATLIKNACVYGADGSKCFYLNLNTKTTPTHARRRRDTPAAGAASPPELSILVQDKNKQGFQVKQKDYCATENICQKYSYSICDNKVKPFQCLVSKTPFFKVVNTDLIGSKNQLHLETGEVVSLCKEPQFACKEPESACVFHAERKPGTVEYVGKSYCSCAGTNITLASHELSCKTSCGGYCAHSDGCAQDYLTNKVTCHCSDGWADTKCDRKVESETTSKAYLIATIVVSIIAAIALIGLAVLYFRRR